MSTTVAEIRSNAELRLRELQLYIHEAEQLRRIIALLDEQPPSRPLAPISSSKQMGEVEPNADDRNNERPRARKGANKRLILSTVLKNPGITAAEVARETGLKRTVVASTMSRLKRTGELESDGKGTRIPAERTAEALALLTSSTPSDQFNPDSGSASLPDRLEE